MPDVLGDVDPIAAVFEAQNHCFGNCAVIVVCGNTYLTPQYHKGLILVGMVMDGDFGAWFQRIEHTMAQIIKRLMKVVVLAQTR